MILGVLTFTIGVLKSTHRVRSSMIDLARDDI